MDLTKTNCLASGEENLTCNGIGEKSPSCQLQTQGSHRLEKYLNLEPFLEKSLKIKSALKST